MDMIQRVRTAVGPGKPFQMLVTFEFPAGGMERMRAVMQKAQTATRAESGCQGYAFCQDAENPNRVVLHESWSNVEVLAKHVEQSHTKELLQTVTAANASVSVTFIRPLFA